MEATKGLLVTVEYAEPDWEVVDYEPYVLDPEVLDRASRLPLMLRGPRPERPLEPNGYFVCLGAAQTFGRFCCRPFPTLLSERLGLPCLNLGRGGAGPSFFCEDSEQLMRYVVGARFVIIQVMSGRSESNSMFRSEGLGSYKRVSDGSLIGCDEAFSRLLAEHDLDFVKHIIEETRRNWIQSYENLLRKIRVPRIMLWFSTRAPEYTEGHSNVHELFGAFPQLVNRAMVERIRGDCDGYVEFVSQRGMPHQLVSRFTGEAVTVRDPWGGEWTQDWYYGSPEMHLEAANALEEPCRALAGEEQ